ncbi:hypothetical protein LCGC14_0666500 [marine sediment metagenome]|uniref:Uncharacterized protein n=1 Tax=marine sediment metagenome TaxID=412755 RepID=A0A0F9QX85_9ZZZZ
MEKEKIIDIKIRRKYEKSNDFKKYYVTGAIGGFKNQYDFRLSFFNVNSNDFLMQTQKFKEQNLSEDELSKKISKMEMPHEIQCELIMTEQAVKELYNFLGKELKALEERRQKTKSN